MSKDLKDQNPKDEAQFPTTTTGFIIFIFKKIIEKKKYWLIPFWSLLLAIALILFLGGNGALLPAIYMSF